VTSNDAQCPPRSKGDADHNRHASGLALT
jgi:hypothetical protein